MSKYSYYFGLFPSSIMYFIHNVLDVTSAFVLSANLSGGPHRKSHFQSLSHILQHSLNYIVDDGRSPK
jgi:amino acid permease